MKNKLIYLDNAATTFPKPACVSGAVDECIRTFCGNSSRGSNPLALKSAEKIFECRCLLADTFGCLPENVIFTYNTTYALNMAIKGVMKGGGHILISNMEHNATLRPVASLQRDGLIEYNTFDAYGKTHTEIIEDIDRKIRPDTRAICCLHTSNICSYSLPIEKIGKYCHDAGLIFICDGAQAGGHIPIDMKKCNIDILCLPAHKGLYGIQGCGVMLLKENISLSTIVEGGNGVNSLDYFMGDESPEKYEAGTLSTPAIVGLGEGLKFLNSKKTGEIQAHSQRLFNHAKKLLEGIPNVKIHDASAGSVLLFNINNISCDEVGEIFSKNNVCVRTGYHCAPLAHRALGTYGTGGIRVSFGVFNTNSHIEILASLTEDISTLKLHL